jgi:hypothetical protein
MARPLEFEFVIRCEDPKREFEELLARRPSEAALETLKRAEKLYRERLRSGAVPPDRLDVR